MVQRDDVENSMGKSGQRWRAEEYCRDITIRLSTTAGWVCDDHSPSLLPQFGQNFAVELTVTPHFGHMRCGVMLVLNSLPIFEM